VTWLETKIGSWADFEENVIAPYIAVTPPLQHSYIFRGQADASWGLAPSFTRLVSSLGFSRGRALEVESELQYRFSQRAHLYIEPHFIPKVGILDWWTLMQHHRAPTRMLDWTHSPLVALYFAVNQRWDVEGAVWMVHRHYLREYGDKAFGALDDVYVTEHYEKLFSLEAPPSRIILVDRVTLTERMVAQQGTFTVAQDVLLDHQMGLEQTLPATEPKPAGKEGEASVHRLKVVVPAALKKKLLRRLHLMNITADALFPGIDGLGTELEELVRIS
jgi:hypothetical protein